MPTYEYECKGGHTFEVVQKMNDPHLTRCIITPWIAHDGETVAGQYLPPPNPHVIQKRCRCKVKRRISAPSFILKGGGWASDGYGSGKSGGGQK